MKTTINMLLVAIISVATLSMYAMDSVSQQEQQVKEVQGHSTEKLNGLLFAAIGADDERKVSELISRGAQVNVKKGPNGFTPLHMAAFVGDVDVCLCLLDGGADVGITDNSGRTPLHWAAFHGHLKACLYLRSNKANVADNSGNTPLDLAVKEGNEDVVKLLGKQHKVK